MLVVLKQPKFLSSSNYANLTLLLVRIAIGVYLISSTIAGGLLNIVAPMDSFDVNFETFMIVQGIVGVLMLTGLFTRIAAIALIGLFALTFTAYDLNAMDQIMLLGIGCALFFKGGLRYSLDCLFFGRIQISRTICKKLSMQCVGSKLFLPSIRIAFGANLIWLGLVEKILVPDMFAAVLEKYHLLPIGVNTELAVFGAGFIELTVGILYLLGIRMRMVSVIMFGILIFTVITFHESVLAHIAMFAISVVFVINGKDSLMVIKTDDPMIQILRKIKNILLLRMYAD